MSANDILRERYRAIILSAALILFIMLIGTVGYYFLSHGKYSLIDCFYMTFITITTIGYSEIIKLDITGRIFTIFISFCGIGIIMYLVSNISAVLIEGELKEVFKEKKMQKNINSLTDHYIVCGAKSVGFHITCELKTTKRQVVVIDISRDNLKPLLECYPDLYYVIGDATDEKILKKAGIEKAKGIFAAIGNDNINLVISLTAKHLNHNIKVVARCQELNHIEKMKKAGADYVVSPNFIGGLRMASEMIRPAVVSFLDVMLRDKRSLRIEEIYVSEKFENKPISEIHLENFPHVLLLAVYRENKWIYNPKQDFILHKGDKLILMTTPDERIKLQQIL